MIFILSTGTVVNIMFPAGLLDLTAAEYEELLELCREHSKERVA